MASPDDAPASGSWEQALRDLAAPEPARRLAAIAALLALGSREAIPLLVECLKHDPEPEVRERAAAAARALSDPARDNPRDPYGQFRI